MRNWILNILSGPDPVVDFFFFFFVSRVGNVILMIVTLELVMKLLSYLEILKCTFSHFYLPEMYRITLPF